MWCVCGVVWCVCAGVCVWCVCVVWCVCLCGECVCMWCVVWCGVCVGVCVYVVCVCVYLFAEDKYDDVSAYKYSSLMTTLQKKNEINLISE